MLQSRNKLAVPSIKQDGSSDEGAAVVPPAQMRGDFLQSLGEKVKYFFRLQAMPTKRKIMTGFKLKGSLNSFAAKSNDLVTKSKFSFSRWLFLLMAQYIF